MNTRAAAAKVIAQLLLQQGSLASLIPEYSEKVAPEERSLLQEMCFGTARWQPQLTLYLDQLLEKPLRKKDQDVYGLLLIGLYQLIYMRTPDHAVLNLTVFATKSLKKLWAKKFINGVLREFLREREQLTKRITSENNSPKTKNSAEQFIFSHPRWLIDRIKIAWPNDFDSIFTANNARAPLTIRVNQTVVSREDYFKLLDEKNIAANKTPLSNTGIQLHSPTDITQLPLFSEGGFSVQDASPQLTPTLLSLEENLSILDACCAPGGKTAHVLEQPFKFKKVVALDVSEKRLERTKTNFSRLNLLSEKNSSPQLLCGDAANPNSWWDGETFDRILLDAPCSATGIIRRQPDIKILRTADNVAKLVTIQMQILSALWPLLKPNGILLYATCSILPEENSQLIEQFVSQTSDAKHLAIEADWGVEQRYGRQLLPSSINVDDENASTKSNHDGFYYAKLRKIPR